MKNRLVQHDNWATPKDVYDKLDAEFHFDFDPCPLFHTKDGLDPNTKWGKRNFVNPPYVRKLKEAFINRAYEESLNGNLSVLLIPVSTSTKIFHDVIYPNAEVRFHRGRINFLPNGEISDKYKGSQMDTMIVIFSAHNSEEDKA